jgi:hypothetical protein
MNLGLQEIEIHALWIRQTTDLVPDLSGQIDEHLARLNLREGPHCKHLYRVRMAGDVRRGG